MEPGLRRHGNWCVVRRTQWDTLPVRRIMEDRRRNPKERVYTAVTSLVLPQLQGEFTAMPGASPPWGGALEAAQNCLTWSFVIGTSHRGELLDEMVGPCSTQGK
jgi:hypothetical protein